MISHDYDSSLETTAPGQCASIEQKAYFTPDFDLRTVSGPDALVRLLGLMADGYFTWKFVTVHFITGHSRAAQNRPG